MTPAAPRRRAYHWTQRLIHWLVALCVLALVPAGLLIDGYQQERVEAVNAALGPDAFNTIYSLHKSVGPTALGLMVLRVVARAVHGEPEYVAPPSSAARVASGVVHAALYALLLLTPIVGWIGVSLYPAPAPFWFLFDARLPLAADRELSEMLLGDVHGPLGILVAILAAAHILAALKHRIVNRDEVWGRMVR